MRTTSRFSPLQFMAPVTSNRPAVKQPRCSPIFLPLSQTAVPNWALLTTSTADCSLGRGGERPLVPEVVPLLPRAAQPLALLRFGSSRCASS